MVVCAVVFAVLMMTLISHTVGMVGKGSFPERCGLLSAVVEGDALGCSRGL